MKYRVRAEFSSLCRGRTTDGRPYGGAGSGRMYRGRAADGRPYGGCGIRQNVPRADDRWSPLRGVRDPAECTEGRAADGRPYELLTFDIAD